MEKSEQHLLTDSSSDIMFAVKSYRGVWLFKVFMGNPSQSYCHMGSHSHLTQVNAPHLNPSQVDRYLIYLPRKDGRLS